MLKDTTVGTRTLSGSIPNVAHIFDVLPMYLCQSGGRGASRYSPWRWKYYICCICIVWGLMDADAIVFVLSGRAQNTVVVLSGRVLGAHGRWNHCIGIVWKLPTKLACSKHYVCNVWSRVWRLMGVETIVFVARDNSQPSWLAKSTEFLGSGRSWTLKPFYL